MRSENSAGNMAGGELQLMSMPAMICIVGSDYNIKFINETVADRMQCKTSDLVGKPVWDMLGGVNSKINKEQMMHVARTGIPTQILGEVVFPSGKRTLTTVLIPFKNEEGVVTDFVAVSYDITAQRDKDQIVRNKMEVILGYAEMLSEMIIDDEIREQIERIRKASMEIKDKLEGSD